MGFPTPKQRCVWQLLPVAEPSELVKVTTAPSAHPASQDKLCNLPTGAANITA